MTVNNSRSIRSNNNDDDEEPNGTKRNDKPQSRIEQRRRCPPVASHAHRRGLRLHRRATSSNNKNDVSADVGAIIVNSEKEKSHEQNTGSSVPSSSSSSLSPLSRNCSSSKNCFRKSGDSINLKTIRLLPYRPKQCRFIRKHWVEHDNNVWVERVFLNTRFEPVSYFVLLPASSFSSSSQKDKGKSHVGGCSCGDTKQCRCCCQQLYEPPTGASCIIYLQDLKWDNYQTEQPQQEQQQPKTSSTTTLLPHYPIHVHEFSKMKLSVQELKDIPQSSPNSNFLQRATGRRPSCYKGNSLFQRSTTTITNTTTTTKSEKHPRTQQPRRQDRSVKQLQQKQQEQHQKQNKPRDESRFDNTYSKDRDGFKSQRLVC